LSCDDGKLTTYLGKKMRSKDIWGVDVVTDRLKLAKKAGIKTINYNIEKDFPFKDNSVDVVTANQVIEHVTNLDHFVGEIYRILKPGGYAIISTENASSWCNIFASVMGWQIFSLTNFSSKKWALVILSHFIKRIKASIKNGHKKLYLISRD
jgi:2-polyprenyl-3-methyl-5-hydroxy-6-metoxy-1,4-benzoquinol methylase